MLMQVFATTFASYNVIAYSILKVSWAVWGYHFYLPEIFAQHPEAPLLVHIASTIALFSFGMLLLFVRMVQFACWGAIFIIVSEHLAFHNSPHDPMQAALIGLLLSVLLLTSIASAFGKLDEEDSAW